MTHTHDHHHLDAGAGDRRVWLAIIVNLLLTLVQIAGGLISGSIALIADAVHNLSDALSLVIAYVARRIARIPSSDTMTFGYARAEIIAALINYTTLVIIGLYLVYEAVTRFFVPAVIDGWLVVIVAGAALVVDSVTAILTFALSRQSMNIKAAFLHNVADALGSIGVILAGACILMFGWTWIDPLVTLLIAGYILWQAMAHIGPVMRILMLGTPHNVAIEEVVDCLTPIEGIIDVHHVHLWQLDEHNVFLEAHLVLDDAALRHSHDVIHEASEKVMQNLDIEHTTFQVESEDGACPDERKTVACF